MASPSGEDAGFILHILTIGFHHKHGSQLEFCFPPLAPGHRPDSGYLPDEWKNLPGLALPDGAHNYEEDNVYFVLPSLTKKERSVFCVSCYRQIDASQLVAKGDDVTRSTVQKSVVVVSKVPLFGAIRERLSQAAQAYFEMRDFSRIDVLQETFGDLRRSFSKGSVMGQMYMGLSVKDLLLRYRQKLLVLFKLLMLERRVMFFMNPASDLTNTLVTLVSMFPNILEDGLDRCTSIINSKYNVKNLAGTDFVNVEKDAESDASVDDCSDLLGQQQSGQRQQAQSQQQQQQQQQQGQQGQAPVDGNNAAAAGGPSGVLGRAAGGAGAKVQEALSGATSLFSSVKTNFLAKVGPQAGGAGVGEMPTDDLQSPFITDDYGFPLPLFAESSVFLPYVSLQQIELLDDANIRACLIGANNSVFKDNKQKADALIGSDQSDFTVQERALAKQLKLTGADEVFMQLLINKIIPSGNDGAPRGDGSAEQTGAAPTGEAEGSDDWLRAQFRMYLLTALLAARSPESEDWQDFNASFIRALQKTYHFKVWSAHDHRGLASMENHQHPCHGQSAIGMKFNQLLVGTEQGRKVTNAVQSTGRVIEDTGKAVGGAIFNARSAMSGFFTGLQTKAASKFSGGEGAAAGATGDGTGQAEADAVDLK